MLTCYIIDDEMHAIKSLLTYIEKTPLLQNVGFNENPLVALSSFQEQDKYPDITFLDIDMPQISGLELSSMLAGKTIIIVTTAHPDFALAAFELSIQDYLLKPFSYQRFLKAIDKANAYASRMKVVHREIADDFFYIQTEGKGKVIRMFFKDVLYIESQKNYVSIVTQSKKNLTYITLTEIEKTLPSYFLRINKSYIINTNKISHVEHNDVFLSGASECITIGTSYKENFILHMKEHLVKSKRPH